MPRWSVLNVDDNAPGRYARTKTLEEHGFSVHEAVSGGEALEKAAELLPDAVLLDVNLPDIDGFTVCASLKAGRETAHIPVVQISASMIEPRHQAHALERGSDAFLAEPVHPTVLVSTLRAAIRAGKAGGGAEESPNP
jgi:CheY-like chemotaxis protein